MLDTSRRWTIAHEVAHSWWTILVGNDSIADPVVDEPLAQYSSCLVVREGLPNAGEVCRAQIVSAYEGMRSLGESDTVADAASDEFRSPFQYSGVVYGKAAWFYIALEEVYGVDRVTDALAALVDRHDFETVTGDDVRSLLMAELGPRAGRLWDRWMRQRHGDADLAEPR
jgi:aminopeptidase N